MIIPNDYEIPEPEPGERPVVLLEILAGTHPAVRRSGAWLDAHPRVALAIFALCALASMVVA